MINKTQMLKGILEGCVLKITEEKPVYSQEIVVTLREYGFDDMSEGTLYPMLLRLEKDGLFETQRVESQLGPSRKYYTLSAKGKKELGEFLTIWHEFKSTVDSIITGKGESDGKQHELA